MSCKIKYISLDFSNFIFSYYLWFFFHLFCNYINQELCKERDIGSTYHSKSGLNLFDVIERECDCWNHNWLKLDSFIPRSYRWARIFNKATLQKAPSEIRNSVKDRTNTFRYIDVQLTKAAVWIWRKLKWRKC